MALEYWRAGAGSLIQPEPVDLLRQVERLQLQRCNVDARAAWMGVGQGPLGAPVAAIHPSFTPCPGFEPESLGLDRAARAGHALKLHCQATAQASPKQPHTGCRQCRQCTNRRQFQLCAVQRQARTDLHIDACQQTLLVVCIASQGGRADE
ncbi:hypothetical protein D3C76_877100 [compost metagenome]